MYLAPHILAFAAIFILPKLTGLIKGNENKTAASELSVSNKDNRITQNGHCVGDTAASAAAHVAHVAQKVQ